MNTSHTTPRLGWSKVAPKAFQAMLGVNSALESSTLGKTLIDLVFARVSQINAWNRLGVGMRLPVAAKPLD